MANSYNLENLEFMSRRLLERIERAEGNPDVSEEELRKVKDEQEAVEQAIRDYDDDDDDDDPAIFFNGDYF